MRDQMPKSKKDLNVELFPQLADALANDKVFCSNFYCRALLSRSSCTIGCNYQEHCSYYWVYTVVFFKVSLPKLCHATTQSTLRVLVCCRSKTPKHIYRIHRVQTASPAVTQKCCKAYKVCWQRDRLCPWSASRHSHHRTGPSSNTISSGRAHCPRATLLDSTSSS